MGNESVEQKFGVLHGFLRGENRGFQEEMPKVQYSDEGKNVRFYDKASKTRIDVPKSMLKKIMEVI
jgi:hypothetical protein